MVNVRQMLSTLTDIHLYNSMAFLKDIAKPDILVSSFASFALNDFHVISFHSRPGLRACSFPSVWVSACLSVALVEILHEGPNPNALLSSFHANHPDPVNTIFISHWSVFGPTVTWLNQVGCFLEKSKLSSYSNTFFSTESCFVNAAD